MNDDSWNDSRRWRERAGPIELGWKGRCSQSKRTETGCGWVVLLSFPSRLRGVDFCGVDVCVRSAIGWLC